MKPRIEKVKAKITSPAKRGMRELEQQKTELENTEIVGMVRGLDVSPEELATLIQAIRSGKAGGSPVALSAEKEDLEDEE